MVGSDGDGAIRSFEVGLEEAGVVASVTDHCALMDKGVMMVVTKLFFSL